MTPIRKEYSKTNQDTTKRRWKLSWWSFPHRIKRFWPAKEHKTSYWNGKLKQHKFRVLNRPNSVQIYLPLNWESSSYDISYLCSFAGCKTLQASERPAETNILCCMLAGSSKLLKAQKKKHHIQQTTSKFDSQSKVQITHLLQGDKKFLPATQSLLLHRQTIRARGLTSGHTQMNSITLLKSKKAFTGCPLFIGQFGKNIS